MIRPVGTAPSLAKRTGGTCHAGCETLRFGPQRRYGMLRIFYLPQFTQDYDQVLAQAPHAIAGEFPRETGSLLTLCWRRQSGANPSLKRISEITRDSEGFIGSLPR